MFETKINIYKVIKMLAKIKHDEDVFKRPLDENSLWYKLSREKVDYRQITFDKMNRDFPQLREQLDINPPTFLFDDRVPPGAPNWFIHTNPRFKSIPLKLDNTGTYKVWDRNPIDNTSWNVENEYRLIYHYVYKISTYNYWWFDLCLIPDVYLLVASSVLREDESGNVRRDLPIGPYITNSAKNKMWDDISQYLSYSPSRDLATSVFLHFASMQEDPQNFIRRTSYMTAPYMPFVEEELVWESPLSKDIFSLNDSQDYVGVFPTIYGIGNTPVSKNPDNDWSWIYSITDLFSANNNKSVNDRLRRQKMFNDFFKALDGANWLEADKLADDLIYLSDATGWGPYIGYGDLSLFIQRMGIPLEYIMTHGLTNAQDELLTNAYGVFQLNNKVIDMAHNIQANDPTFKNSITQNLNRYTDLGLYNSYVDDVIQASTELNVKIRDAFGDYLMTNGSINDAKKILSNAPTLADGIDALKSRAVSLAIDKEIENLQKAKR